MVLRTKKQCAVIQLKISSNRNDDDSLLSKFSAVSQSDHNQMTSIVSLTEEWSLEAFHS